jgi:Asp/Glu/hydantoin racemase
MARIVLLNANTNAAMTVRMLEAGRAALDPRFSLSGLTAPFGPAYITDADTCAVAASAVAAMARGLAPVPDAAVVACFGDPGLAAARAALPCPVVGMAEASLHAACQIGRRVAVITGGRAWGPIIAALAADIGLSARVAAVRTLELTGDRIAADPDAALATLAGELEAAAADGADVAILGGAGLLGLAERLRPSAPLPVLDSLACAVTQAAALAAMGPLGRPQPGA